MRKCKHKQTQFTWRVDDERRWVFVSHCHDCGEAMSLGPSNDVGCEVEIRAAEIDVGRKPSAIEQYGMDRAVDGRWFAYHHRPTDRGFQAGWLAYCISNHVNPMRPVAEQGPGEVERPTAAALAALARPLTALDQVAAEHATFNAAAERYGDLRQSAASHLANLINTECDAAIASADAKQAACDAHGYGGKPPIDPSQLVGLTAEIDTLADRLDAIADQLGDRRGDL